MTCSSSQYCNWPLSTHHFHKFCEHPLKTFYLLVAHQHTGKQYTLEMVVHSDKYTEWHVIQISLVCSVECNNVTKMMILELAPTICPQQRLNSAFRVNLHGVGKLAVLFFHLRENLHCFLNIIIALFSTDFPTQCSKSPLSEWYVFYLPKKSFQ